MVVWHLYVFPTPHLLNETDSTYHMSILLLRTETERATRQSKKVYETFNVLRKK